MPNAHFSSFYGVTDCKIYPLTADTSSGSPTYGTGVDVPGIKSVKVGGSITVKKLRGDNRPLATRAVIEDITAEVEHGYQSLDVLKALFNATVTDTGTTPAMKTTFNLTGAQTPVYVKLEAQTTLCDFVAGDGHVILYKCMLTAFPEGGFVEEDFVIPKFSLSSVPCISNGAWYDIVFNETAVAVT
jgi:hypothetical protein